MNIEYGRLCVCGDEEAEHITMTDGSVYCHACWFHGGEGPTTENGADERSRHTFQEASSEPSAK